MLCWSCYSMFALYEFKLSSKYSTISSFYLQRFLLAVEAIVLHSKRFFISLMHAHKHPLRPALPHWWNYIWKNHFWFLSIYSRLFHLLQMATSQNLNLLKMNFMLCVITKWGSFGVLQSRISIFTKWGIFFLFQSESSGIKKWGSFYKTVQYMSSWLGILPCFTEKKTLLLLLIESGFS